MCPSFSAWNSPSLSQRAATGGLRVQTEPAHLAVFVDGNSHGASPVSIDQLQPGEHEVSVKTATGVVRRSVTIQPRETISLIVSSAAPAADPGAVSPDGSLSRRRSVCSSAKAARLSARASRIG